MILKFKTNIKAKKTVIQKKTKKLSKNHQKNGSNNDPKIVHLWTPQDGQILASFSSGLPLQIAKTALKTAYLLF